jgi:hypothetical protein
MDSLADVIRSSPVVVHRDEYVVAQVRAVGERHRHFAVFHDAIEQTVVTTTDGLSDCDVIRLEGPFALLEFRVAVPFEAPGFLTTICRALAEREINVLVYSTYSRDYVLVRKSDQPKSVEALGALGFPFTSA